MTIPTPSNSVLRIAAYNIEWFNALFGKHDQLLFTDDWSARYNVTKAMQARAIAEVLRLVDADIFAIIESPDDQREDGRSVVRALEGFAKHYGLRQNKAMLGFPSGTRQEITLLYDPKRISAIHTPKGRRLEEGGLKGKNGAHVAKMIACGKWSAPRFDGKFPLTINGETKVHHFSKPPLEATITDRMTGRQVELIAVHAKSKSTARARNKADQERVALDNRRRQLAQCTWLRLRAERFLDLGADFIILGDFNDGPGQDVYEQHFGKSGVEVVMGDIKVPDRLLRNPYTHTQENTKDVPRPTTARFYNQQKKKYEGALLDFIMLSPDLARQAAAKWHIWHALDNLDFADNEKARSALLDASDHFPVSVDLWK